MTMDIRRVIYALVITLVGALSLPASAAVSSDSVWSARSVTPEHRRAFDYYYLQALALKEQGAHDAALEMFEHCLSLDASSPSVLFELSTYYMFLGRKNEALQMMQRAVKEEPSNFWYRQILATAYEDNGRRSDAISVYESMAADFPANTEMYLILAGYYSEEGMYSEALSSLEAYERKEGKSEHISMQKYNVCLMMEDSLRAIEEAGKLAADYPDDLRYRVLLGDVYMHNGNFAGALEIYEKVLAAEPGNVNGQLAMVNLYKMSGNDSLFRAGLDTLLMNPRVSPAARSELMAKALPEIARDEADSIYTDNLFQRLIELPGNQLPVIVLYVQYLNIVKAGEEKIAPLLNTILQIEPENKMAQLQLLSYAIKHENYDEIISRADTAILYNPEMLQLYYYRGLASYLKKEPAKAAEVFRQGLRNRAEDTEDKLVSELFTLLGDTEHELGNQVATLEAYDSALVYNPRNIQVLNNYAYYLAQADSALDRAEEMSLITIKEEPESAIYIDTYMWVLFKQKRYEEAKAYAEKLMSADEEMNAVEYSHCGDIFYHCGDVERALDCWTEAQMRGDDSKILKRKIKKKRYIPDAKDKK